MVELLMTVQTAFHDLRDYLANFSIDQVDNLIDTKLLVELEDRLTHIFEMRDNLPRDIIDQLVELYVTCGALLEGFSSPMKLNNEMKRMLRLIQSY